VSVEAITWALRQEAGHSSAKFVLVALANCADADGVCWPSIAYLCDTTEQNRKTVIDNLKRLREAGLIVQTGDMKGRTGLIPVYRLNVRTNPKTGPFKRTQKRDRSEDFNDPENGTVDDDATDPKTEPLKQSQKRNSSENGTVPKTEPVTVPKTVPVTVPKTGHGTVIGTVIEPKDRASLLSGKPDRRGEVREVLKFLQNMTGRAYREVPSNVRLIESRLKNTSLEDIKRVLVFKGEQWLDDPTMSQYLRPITLFRASNFEQYLAEALANHA
jgi:uncharacterized phage protein (TIGR02220 family)